MEINKAAGISQTQLKISPSNKINNLKIYLYHLSKSTKTSALLTYQAIYLHSKTKV